MSKPYYHTKESVDEYIRLAEGFDGQHLIDQLTPLLTKNARILEIGSGPGKDWQILNKTFDVVGSDFSGEFVARLSVAHPDHTFLQLNASTLDTQEMFDCIYSNKVLQHLTDDELRQGVAAQASILNKQGLICHSFWKGEGSETFKGMFVNYHDEAGLRKFFGGDFDIVVMEAYEEFEAGDSLVMIGSKR